MLFVDRLSPLKRQFLKKELDEIAKGDIPDDYHPTGEAQPEGEEPR